MIEPIFIECRFWGWTRDYFKELNKKLVHRGSEIIKVPHMALYGGTQTSSLKHVLSIIESVAGQYELVPFSTGDFSYFDNPDKKWNIIRINPSPELEAFRLQMAESLIRSQIAPPQSYDLDKNYYFHISIGKTEYIKTFNNLRTIIRTWEPPDMNLHLLRISIIGKDQKIRFEYDLILKRWLNRKQALSAYWRRKTIDELRRKLGLPSFPLKTRSNFSILFNFFRNLFGKKNIYLIADTHFDHANIIRYCNRPFKSVSQMDKTIVGNWNKTVKENDIVYFLGDWSYGPGSRPSSYWGNRLNGQIISVRGSHDGAQSRLYSKNYRVLHKGKSHFLLVHNPDERRNKWKGWIIHGHKHNNEIKKHPFINGETKTINVSVEMTDYEPVNLDYLLSLDLDSIKRMEIINSKPERW